jgi:ketosteroid isomerase-like protein
MRTVRGWILLSILFVVAGCAKRTTATSRVSAAPTSEVAAIRAVFDATAAGWNRGDLATYLSGYDNSATTMGRNGLVHGPSAIGDQMRAGFWKTGRPTQVLSFDHLEVRPLGRNHALATGQFILSGNGLPQRTGWFTTIWERTPAGWRMIHDHSS